MNRLLVTTLAVAFASLASFGGAHAQATRCVVPAEGVRVEDALLRRTLPAGVLDHLERMQTSAFVHAFLLGFVAHDSAGDHPVARCARNFAGAGIADLPTLRDNLPDVPALLAALRTAEQAQAQAEQMARSAPTLGGLLRDLVEDTTTATLHTHGERLAELVSRCGSLGAGACGALTEVQRAIDTAIAARTARDAAADAARQAAEAEARARATARAEREALTRDSVARANPQPGQSEAELQELDRRISERRARLADMEGTAGERSTAEVDTALERTRQNAQTADDKVREAARALSQLLRSGVMDHTVETMQGAPLAAAVDEVSVPPVGKTGTLPPVRSANVLLELTDFIIDRARSELVIAFVINLHASAEENPLIRSGFPETWRFMSGLSTREDGLLNAGDVGLIPLTTWRATLAEDFVSLPVNLIEAGGGDLCRDAAASVAGEWRCAERVALLRPLAPVAKRLLQGDPVFDVLRDAGGLETPGEPRVRDAWLRISQGLTAVSMVAESYRSQGHLPAANPVRHPYILTAASFRDVPIQQRNAFLRLLVMRAFPDSAVTLPGGLDETSLRAVASDVVEGLDRLATRPVRDTLQAPDPAFLVRGSLDVLTRATNFAEQFAADSTQLRIRAVRERWEDLSAVIETIAARDFGLAMARTTVMLHRWRGKGLPKEVLTLLSLSSALTEARDGDDVQSAFRAAASPLGGWQAKRYGEGRLSITALPGAAGGFEWLIPESNDPQGIGSRSLTVGASLPIGFEWNPEWMRNEYMDTRRCVVCQTGFFIPLIDLGALLSYRVSGPDEVESEPNATVRQVFAPGAFLTASLTRSAPLTLFIGAQLLPSLRKVEVEPDVEPENRSAWRITAGVGIDVHLFGF